MQTFVTDCPLFKRRIVIDAFELIVESDDRCVCIGDTRRSCILRRRRCRFAPVGHMSIRALHTESKPDEYDAIAETRVR